MQAIHISCLSWTFQYVKISMNTLYNTDMGIKKLYDILKWGKEQEFNDLL